VVTADYAASLDYEWSQIEPTFAKFHETRDLQGTWKLIMHGLLPPDIHPDLKIYAQGLKYMTGMLREDFRQLKQLHNANPTMIDARVRGSTQTARNLERDFKLTWASWWDNDLNEGRVLDSRNYEGQIGLGLKVERIRWKPQIDEDGTSGCPIEIEDILIDTVSWHGNFHDPDAFWCRYTLPVIDCDVKNSQGERPAYDGETLGWVGESLPENFYANNASKSVEIIVRDAVDPLAMCPLPGHMHRKRRITTYICKPGSRAGEYMEVDCSDSPFEKCSFVVTGGDVNGTERDPHEILRPSAWILIDLVLKYNFYTNSLIATFAREMADERLYLNASAAAAEVLQALSPEDDGQELKKPELGDKSIPKMPGQVSMFPKPSTAELMELLRQTKEEYMLYRPNRNLTGQAAVAEVTGTAAVLNNQGAGLMFSEDLVNWDTSHKRFFKETMHGICFTEHFRPSGGDPIRYIGIVSGRENVKGSRGEVGQEVFLDAKKAANPVSFSAETSKDTPQDRRDREERARTAFKEGIFTERDRFEAYGIFDPEMQEEELFRQGVRKFLEPMEQRRIAARLVARSAALTGVDMGEEQQVENLPLPDPKTGTVQTHNTLEANQSRLHTPPVELAPTNSPTGGSSGLG
jgi:hypothetical protein